jgi:hypothetical protein
LIFEQKLKEKKSKGAPADDPSRKNLLRIPGVPTNICLAVCFVEDAIEGRSS